MGRPLIALTTDFGSGSPYVAQMKGVLLSAAPDAVLVDVAHDLRPFAIADAELLLRSTAFAFPLGAVHVVVVDPGVGGTRRPIAAQLKGMTFVGPDNGVLGALTTHAEAHVVELDRVALHRRPTAPTFHGRDIFAPVAAELAMGVPLTDVGTPITDAVASTLPLVSIDGDVAHGVTLGADRYGNVTTNVPARFLRNVAVSGKELLIVRTYVEAPSGQLVALAGSDGYVEIAVREGSAAALLGEHGTAVVCRRNP